MEQTADNALIGLAVMGQNLIMNMNDHGYTVVAYNRTTSKVDEFLDDAAKGRTTILGAHSIEEMVTLLKRPRKIMLMVKAGKPVDEFIETLLPHLEPGDLIIDTGTGADSMTLNGPLTAGGHVNLTTLGAITFNSGVILAPAKSLTPLQTNDAQSAARR